MACVRGWVSLSVCVCVCVFGALAPFFAEIARLLWEKMGRMPKTGRGWHETYVVARDTFALCPSALQISCAKRQTCCTDSCVSVCTADLLNERRDAEYDRWMQALIDKACQFLWYLPRILVANLTRVSHKIHFGARTPQGIEHMPVEAVSWTTPGRRRGIQDLAPALAACTQLQSVSGRLSLTGSLGLHREHLRP